MRTNNNCSTHGCCMNLSHDADHKHLQFMPIEEGGPPIEKLARAVRLESPGQSRNGSNKFIST